MKKETCAILILIAALLFAVGVIAGMFIPHPGVEKKET